VIATIALITIQELSITMNEPGSDCVRPLPPPVIGFTLIELLVVIAIINPLLVVERYGRPRDAF